MYYIYILYSNTSKKYYTGFSEDVERRIIEHNTDPRDRFTMKHRPWELKGKFEVGPDRGVAMKIEKYIKRLKSRKVIETLLELKDINYIIEMMQRGSVG